MHTDAKLHHEPAYLELKRRLIPFGYGCVHAELQKACRVEPYITLT